LLAEVCQSLGHYEQAQKCLNLCLEIELLEALYNLGSVYGRKGELELAEDSLLKALKVNPQHLDSLNKLGSVYVQQQRHQQALAVFDRVLRVNPMDADAYFEIGMICRTQRDFARAIENFRKALEFAQFSRNREYVLATAGHLAAALEGKATKKPSNLYVEHLFDTYADSFEGHLTQKLLYKVPEAIRDLVVHAAQCDRFPRVLDLGCGTGLMGDQVRDIVDELVGVDISGKMLAIADDKGTYSRLVKSELSEFLKHEQGTFDLVLAADVFIYVGELEEVFSQIAARMETGGFLAFSVEQSKVADRYELVASGRYAHGRDYILRIAKNAHLQLIEAKNIHIRKEKDGWIDGGIYLLSKIV